MSFPPANHNPAIDPTGQQVRDLRDSRDNAPDGPIVMLNLLKFHAKARYPDGAGFAGTGAEAYARYQHNFTVTVGAISQAEVLFDGPVMRQFIGGDADWDRMLIVRYPSRQHFLAMMADEGYKAGLIHRYAALERTTLLQCK